MLRFRASLTVAVLVAASLMLSVPASAGGPTSALLSVPGEGKTASLYYTDPEYVALADLVGIDSETGTGKVDQSGLGHDNGPGVTVTWLIHDVTPWRVDHIYLNGEGAPWIATQVSGESGMTWDSPVVWHQPASAAELVALLDKLGVGEASREAGDFSGVAGAPLPAPAEPAPAPAEPAPAEASPSPASGGDSADSPAASCSPCYGCGAAGRIPTRRRTPATSTRKHRGSWWPRSCPDRAAGHAWTARRRTLRRQLAADLPME